MTESFNSLEKTRITFRILPLFLVFYLLSVGLAEGLPEQNPSPGILRERVGDFWKALQAGKKLEGLEFVYPADRELFLSRPLPQFTDPVIVSSELSAKQNEALVTVEVTRYLPFMAGPVRFTVAQQWILRDGIWYARESPPGTPYVSQQNPAALNPIEAERRRNIVRAQLSFEGDEIDFGVIRIGAKSTVEMGYEVAGIEPIAVELENPPEGLTVRGLEEGKLVPGRDKRIQLDYQCDVGHGPVAHKFMFRVRHMEVDVSYPFTIRAKVYSPVSASPVTIKMKSEEPDKTILLTNNSRSIASIALMKSEKDSLDTHSLPLVLRPGQSAQIKVRLKKKIEETNYKEKITLVFKKPVEDMGSLLIPVTVNPAEPLIDIPLGLTREQVEELLKKIRGTIKP